MGHLARHASPRLGTARPLPRLRTQRDRARRPRKDQVVVADQQDVMLGNRPQQFAWR